MSGRGLRALWYGLGAAAACGPASAQCSMCRTAVAAQGAGGTLDRAILILLVPAVAIFSSVFLLACRYGSSDPGRDRDEGTVD